MSATDPLLLVPAPLSVRPLEGSPFVLGPDLRVVVGDTPEEIGAGVLAAEVIGALVDTPLGLQTGDDPAPGAVHLRLADDAGPLDADPTERYSLTVTADGVEVLAPRAAGLLHGVATLRQLLRPGPDGEVTVPAVVVHDAPRYEWRGLSLDVVRHFFTVDQVTAVLGLMSELKLNVLHLHLSDDQGWRLDVPSRPELAARSSGTEVGGGPGGCYSADDFAQIVAHAAARHITVVPEIDVPGHVNAALHALPELTPDGVAPPPYTGTEVGFSRLHRDVPATRAFLQDVLGDVAAMTPGPYLHIGGDEVLTMAPEEYRWFVRTAQDVARAAGKTVVGWQEIALADVEPGTVVQFWDPRADPEPFAAAAAAGARLLMSPGSRVYLDMKYDADSPLGLDWAGFVEVRDSYDWDPDAAIPGVPADAVVGVEAAVWTETVPTLEDLFVMLLPRLAAVAEVAWSAQDRRGWAGFRTRVAGLAAGWDRAGYPWYPSPQVDW
ncbi:family 20 glycosylhydrolase [Cellulomonas sp. ATA003]|uniref:family 20 glycosylhydrolase n=1 Tax=Cellulomonas sp. ATA003 TaxID=3073064 RepID=UPI0028733CE2|nr:family 20 glycosylhydrolase [Cellulomonas sp. ATA003]WNB85102.1 family 20 glycosylhydrolase [Cellulomonas sp. ATA003]